MSMDESGRIAMLARVLTDGRGQPEAGIEVGIGDDAAVLATSHALARLVWTIDEQVEGVHFRRELVTWKDVGWRSFMAAASDIAAMGALPWCALCALVLPDDVDDTSLEDLALGQREAADAIGAPVAGGNLSRGLGSHGTCIATTLLGTCEHAVQRKGACPGDGVWAAGALGLAAAGRHALEKGVALTTDLERAAAAWRRPTALIAQGRVMAAVAHAAIDVSDGLARDVGHLSQSGGVCIVLDENALVADQALVAAAGALGASALDLALHGGEDYALVVASPVSIPGFLRIGEVRKGTGLVLRGPAGERPIEPRGFDHFSR